MRLLLTRTASAARARRVTLLVPARRSPSLPRSRARCRAKTAQCCFLNFWPTSRRRSKRKRRKVLWFRCFRRHSMLPSAMCVTWSASHALTREGCAAVPAGSGCGGHATPVSTQERRHPVHSGRAGAGAERLRLGLTFNCRTKRALTSLRVHQHPRTCRCCWLTLTHSRQSFSRPTPLAAKLLCCCCPRHRSGSRRLL